MNYEIVQQCKDKYGYLFVNLIRNEKSEKVYMHRIVAKTFLKNLENKNGVRHINGIITDNRSVNIEWSDEIEKTEFPIIKAGEGGHWNYK